MFTLSINISPSSGAATFSSQLSEVRGKLNAINSTIRDLESNLILLIVHPEIVVLNNAKKSEGSDEGEENTTSQVIIVENYNTNPVEILSDISEAWSLRKTLFSNEYYLIYKVMESQEDDNPYNLSPKTT